jgi:hypothetical protein
MCIPFRFHSWESILFFYRFFPNPRITKIPIQQNINISFNSYFPNKVINKYAAQDESDEIKRDPKFLLPTFCPPNGDERFCGDGIHFEKIILGRIGERSMKVRRGVVFHSKDLLSQDCSTSYKFAY